MPFFSCYHQVMKTPNENQVIYCSCHTCIYLDQHLYLALQIQISNYLMQNLSLNFLIVDLPNRHILFDSPLIRRQNSTWKVRRNDIDFERRIHVEIMTSIWRGNFDVDSTFKIDEISMSSPRGIFEVVSTSNRRNFCTCCFHCIIF